MIGVPFKQANFTWKGWSEDEGDPGGQGTPPEVYDLPVYKNEEGQSLSCWKMTWKERLEVLLTGRVWLWVIGHHPPVSVEGENPFKGAEHEQA